MSRLIVILTMSSLPACALKGEDGRDVERLQLLKTFQAEFVPITPGKGKFPKSFQMGSEEGAEHERPVHTVTFGDDFAIARYEVPQNLYQAVMGRNPSRWQGPRNSVEEVTRSDAERFCQKITELMRAAKLLGDDEEIRLPTEAEWEYCCRAGTTTAYSFGEEARADADAGDAASVLDQYAWHTGNAAGNDPPVGALKPNPWGLFDMHGYLWEFVADDWHDSYAGAPADGSRWRGDEESAKVVLRGGSWQEGYDHHRSATRRGVPKQFHNDAVGFRCVRAKVAK